MLRFKARGTSNTKFPKGILSAHLRARLRDGRWVSLQYQNPIVGACAFSELENLEAAFVGLAARIRFGFLVGCIIYQGCAVLCRAMPFSAVPCCANLFPAKISLVLAAPIYFRAKLYLFPCRAVPCRKSLGAPFRAVLGRPCCTVVWCSTAAVGASAQHCTGMTNWPNTLQCLG